MSEDALTLTASADDREGKLALVRKLMLAIKRDDEHAALDAIETLVEECGGTLDADDGET